MCNWKKCLRNWEIKIKELWRRNISIGDMVYVLLLMIFANSTFIHQCFKTETNVFENYSNSQASAYMLLTYYGLIIMLVIDCSKYRFKQTDVIIVCLSFVLSFANYIYAYIWNSKLSDKYIDIINNKYTGYLILVLLFICLYKIKRISANSIIGKI